MDTRLKARRQGAIPHSRHYCWVKQRTMASNMIKNILRAVRSGNCSRARHIHASLAAQSAMSCADSRTKRRVERLVRSCKGG